jgi:hypothetical protein
MHPSERQSDLATVAGEPALASASGPPPQRTAGALKSGLGALLLGLLAKGKGLLIMLKALPLAKVLLTGGAWGWGRCSSCPGRLSYCTGHGPDDPPAHPAKAGIQKRRVEPLPVWARGL